LPIKDGISPIPFTGNNYVSVTSMIHWAPKAPPFWPIKDDLSPIPFTENNYISVTSMIHWAPKAPPFWPIKDAFTDSLYRK
jgi:hypothetical protein